MKIFIVHIGEVMLCPPVVNLMKMLEKKHIETVLISTESKYFKDDYRYIQFKPITVNYERKRNLLHKTYEMFGIRKAIWNIIDKSYEKDDVIWLTSNTALKHVGTRILKYNYVFQLMELSEKLKYHPKFPFAFDAKKIGNNAAAVVVPEYNRAHIVKAWWELNEKPLILSNKPYQEKIIEKCSYIEDDYARGIIDRLKGKKIILYQGIIHRERPLDKYIYAVDKLGDDYAFVVMSNGENIYEGIDSKNYYFIPFIAPPDHLQVTSHAYIGVLSYFPVKSDYSILNALYCAPNKTFEYAMFGIPMLGNDNPGLKYIFDTHKAGISVESFDVDNIVSAIKTIENNYDFYCKGAEDYYSHTDTEQELNVILDHICERIRK
ncbi:MAG: glycosyltransferase [Butyrivibrio sp.]|nr:glycosyltransferase [Butyrivibrio sp.]